MGDTPKIVAQNIVNNRCGCSYLYAYCRGRIGVAPQPGVLRSSASVYFFYVPATGVPAGIECAAVLAYYRFASLLVAVVGKRGRIVAFANIFYLLKPGVINGLGVNRYQAGGFGIKVGNLVPIVFH